MQILAYGLFPASPSRQQVAQQKPRAMLLGPPLKQRAIDALGLFFRALVFEIVRQAVVPLRGIGLGLVDQLLWFGLGRDKGRLDAQRLRETALGQLARAVTLVHQAHVVERLAGLRSHLTR